MGDLRDWFGGNENQFIPVYVEPSSCGDQSGGCLDLLEPKYSNLTAIQKYILLSLILGWPSLACACCGLSYYVASIQ